MCVEDEWSMPSARPQLFQSSRIRFSRSFIRWWYHEQRQVAIDSTVDPDVRMGSSAAVSFHVADTESGSYLPRPAQRPSLDAGGQTLQSSAASTRPTDKRRRASVGCTRASRRLLYTLHTRAPHQRVDGEAPSAPTAPRDDVDHSACPSARPLSLIITAAHTRWCCWTVSRPRSTSACC